MSVRNGLVLLVALCAVMFLAGCGSSGSSATITPPPSGGFTTSSLSGTYVFSFSGTDIMSSSFADSASYFAVAGALAASGGSLTGTIDINDPELEAALNLPIQPLTNQAVTSGSYSITADGRGTGTIAVSINGNRVQFGIDFVLMSSSHGLITRFDDNGTGSGTIDLQGSPSQSGLTSYAFTLSGVDSNENPFASVGDFTLGGTTNISTGLQDFNDDENSTSLTSLSLGGTVTLGAAGAAGTATLTATGSPYGTLSFDVWPIDNTHMKLIETDTTAVLAGDAYTEATSISSGQLVYTMSGLDANNSSSLLASGGFMSYDGTSAVSAGYEDINDGGSVGSSLTVSGTLTSSGANTGRYDLSLGGFYNSTSGAGTYSFAAYPTASAGILLMETDNLGVTGGAAYPQSAQTFATSQGYGLNLSGANQDGEVDDIAEFTANSGTVSNCSSGGIPSNGAIDENDEGSLNFKAPLGPNGTFCFDSPSTGRGELVYPDASTLIGTLSLDFYVANSSTVLFIDVDSGTQTGVGVFQVQNSSSSGSAVAHPEDHANALKAAATVRARRKN